MVDITPPIPSGTPDELTAALWTLLKDQTRTLRQLRHGLTDALALKLGVADDQITRTALAYRMWLDEEARLAQKYRDQCRRPQVYPVELISFGYLHGDPPTAERVEDVRDLLRDRAAARDILDLDGTDQRVLQVVLATPGAAVLVDELVTYAEDLPTDQPRRIAIGSTGGRHRSVALVRAIAGELQLYDIPVMVRHRDIHRPRVIRSGGEQQ